MDAIPKRSLSPKSTPKTWIFLTLLLVPTVIGARSHLYLKRPDRLLTFFHKTKKEKNFFKDSFISEFLAKIKGVHFSFFYLFQITCDGIFIFAYSGTSLKRICSKADTSLRWTKHFVPGKFLRNPL